jgi:hypothetical protein
MIGKVRWAILHVPLRGLIAGLHHHTQHFRKRPAPRSPRQPQRPFRWWLRQHPLPLHPQHHESRAGRVPRAVLRKYLHKFKFSAFDSQGEIKATLAELSSIRNFKHNESLVSAAIGCVSSCRPHGRSSISNFIYRALNLDLDVSTKIVMGIVPMTIPVDRSKSSGL